MTRPIKILAIAAWTTLGILSLTLVAARLIPAASRGTPVMPVIGHAPAFSLTNQEAKAFGSADLQGKVWAVDFIFTRCPGPCPAMSGKFAKAQQQLADSQVRLVSFSVDAEYDTPAVLKEYAAKYQADPARWTLLTGAQKEVETVARAMNIFVKNEGTIEGIGHQTYFLLVDAAGDIHGPYSGLDDEGWQHLVADARALDGKSK